MKRRSRLVVSLLVLGSGGACHQILAERRPVGTCGDNVVQEEMGEECDGAPVNGLDCSPTCTLERCGNGRKDRGEECDLGLANDNGGDCTLDCKKARCGDRFVKTRGEEPYEVCDDGNNENGDGCNPDCSLRGRVAVIGGTPGGLGFADGIGAAARFGVVTGMAADQRHLYLYDNEGCAIRRMELATGEVETIAGTPGVCWLTRDGIGAKAGFSNNSASLALVGTELYVGERLYLRRVDLADGKFTVDTCLELPDKGINSFVTALASDPGDATRLYLATRNGIYRVKLPCTCDVFASTGKCVAELLAGGADALAKKDGVGQAARFVNISALALGPAHEVLYVADTAASVRRLDLTTMEVQTKAGGSFMGHVDGVGPQARFYSIEALVHGGASDLLVLEQSLEVERVNGVLVGMRRGWGNVRRVDTQTWKVETLAGTYGTTLSGNTPEVDGFGPHARFVEPYSATRVGDILYVGQGAALRAVSLHAPYPVATAAGVLVQDFTHYKVRAVAAHDGQIYFATRAGELVEMPVQTAGPGRKVGLCPTVTGITHKIDAITVHGAHLYVLDAGIYGVCRVDLDGKLGAPCCLGCRETCAVVFQLPGMEHGEYFEWRPEGLAFDGTYLYLPDRQNMRVLRVDPATGKKGSYTELTRKNSIDYPGSLVYLAPFLYVTSPDTHQVFRIDPKTGAVHALGDGQRQTSDGAGGKASFCAPAGIATDGERLFVGEGFCGQFPGEWRGHAVRQVDLSEGKEQVTTLVGPGPEAHVVEGVGRRGGVNWPAALAYDSATRSLYVADRWDNVLLQID